MSRGGQISGIFARPSAGRHGRRFAPTGLWTLPGLPGLSTAQTDAPPTAPWMAANGRRHPQSLGKPANGRRFSTSVHRPRRQDQFTA